MEKKEIVANSLLKVLEEAGQKTIVKNFYNNAKDNVIYYHDIVLWGRDAMKENVKSALKIFS